MIILKNSELEVHLHPKGAEIHKIIGVHDGLNYMWRRDPSLWASSAPILFPIVGAVTNDTYRIGTTEYHLKQHGFARHNEFDVSEQTDTSVLFTLRSNDEIKTQYPYLFELRVRYELNGDTLSCAMEVENIDSQPISFGIGGHPAFAVPLMEGESSNDYYLEFSETETLDSKVIDIPHRAVSMQREPIFDQERRFFIRQALFSHDAMVFENVKSEHVSIKSLNHNKQLIFHMHHFNHLGIWASQHVGGLIAIEPWVGHADALGFTGELKDKEGVQTIQPKEVFACDFAIEIKQ